MFEHSIKVPRLYSSAAKIVETVTNKGGSAKNLVYDVKHCNTKGLFALVVNTLKRNNQLDFLFRRTKILEKEPRLNPWLGRVLITELLWGKKRLPGESKPIKTILAYQQILNAHATDVYEDQQNNLKGVKPRFVRVNTLLTSINEVIDGFRNEDWTLVRHTETKNYDDFLQKVSNLADNEFMVDIHIPELLIFPPNTQFFSHHAYRNGLIILQDKASCLPVHLLNPTEGSNVLDMCAAPGMKTSQLAARLNNNGKVYAVDLDESRLKTLENLMEATGVTCVEAIKSDVLKLTNRECPDVEYILVDPSCSGSGIVGRLDFNKEPVKDEKRIKKLRGFQIMILKHALRRFPNAKRVIYSTCSIYPEENEDVIKEVIPQISNYKLVPVKDFLKISWCNFGSEEYGDIGKSCLYSKHDTDLTNGFFIAIFERLKDGEQNPYFVQNSFYQLRNANCEQDAANESNAITENVSKEMKRKKEAEDKNESSTEEPYRKNIKTNLDIEVHPLKKKKKKHSDCHNSENIPENSLNNINLNLEDDKKHGTSLNYDEINFKTKSKKKHKPESQNVEITTTSVKKTNKKQKSKSEIINLNCRGELDVPLEINKEMNEMIESTHVLSTEKSRNDELINQNNATELSSKRKKNKKKKHRQEITENEKNETLNKVQAFEGISEEKKVKTKRRKQHSVDLNVVENKFDRITNQKDGNELEMSPESRNDNLQKKKHRKKHNNDLIEHRNSNELEESLKVSPESIKKQTYKININETVDQTNSNELENSIKIGQEKNTKEKRKMPSLHDLTIRNNNSDEISTEANKDDKMVDQNDTKNEEDSLKVKEEKAKKKKDKKKNADALNMDITNNDEYSVETNKNVIKKLKKEKLDFQNNTEDSTPQSSKKNKPNNDDNETLNDLEKSLLEEAKKDLEDRINRINKTSKRQHKRKLTNEMHDSDNPKSESATTLKYNCSDQRYPEEKLEKNKKRKHKKDKEASDSLNTTNIVNDANVREREEFTITKQTKISVSICNGTKSEKPTEEATNMDFGEENFTPEELDMVNMLNEYLLNRSKNRGSDNR